MTHLRRSCALLVAALWLAAPSARALDEGERAPDFAARLLDGSGNVSLAKYRGKIVYLDFWASWCGPCQKSLPALEKLREELPRGEFQILAVNVDRDPDKARALLAKHGIGYPSASDPEGRLPERYGLQTMPTSYLIDRKGVVRHVHRGFRAGDVDGLRQRILELVGEKR